MGGCLILAGMMGSGKTAVGRAVAERLARPYVDLDRVIADEAGAPDAAALLSREGEASFRERERHAVAGLRGLKDHVVATGGWTVGDASSRETLESMGTVICLRAAPSALAARLSADATARPTLGGAPSEARLAALLEGRRAVYDALPWQVETTGRSVDAVAGRVVRLAAAVEGVQAAAVPVAAPNGGYACLFGAGLMDALGEIAAARGVEGPVLVATDPTVADLYGRRTMAALERGEVRAVLTVMSGGESGKSLATVAEICRSAVEAGIDRSGALVALGGGVVGDTAGFAASVFMRGIAAMHVPTTLLAMVDASIGGKTAVNLEGTKNLVGTFHHPVLVIADTSTLATLPDRVLRAGLAEVVKAGLVGDPGLLDALRAGPPPPTDAAAWATLAARAGAVKSAVVGEDPGERGRRILLNLGHTFAHGLESATRFEMSHGEAVAVGLVAAATLAGRLAVAPPDLAGDVASLLAGLGLPTRFAGADHADVLSSMAPDKKRSHGRLRFVLPRAPGDVVVVDDVAEADVRAAIEAVSG